MAHKKSILSKFLNEPESTEDSPGDRSLIHDGVQWVIPETSTSDLERKNSNEGTEDENGKKKEEVQPTTSRFQNPQPNYTSTSKSPIFKTNNSSVSPPTPPRVIPTTYIIETSFNHINNSSTTSYEKTVPIIQAFNNPIEPTTSDSPIEIGTSDNSTDIIITTGTTDETDGTKIIFTSTPLNTNPPPLRASTMETSSGDNFSIPSAIFGSPPTPPTPMEIEEYTSNYHQRQSSSEQEEEFQRQLDENLRRMQAALSQEKQRKKKKFFEDMLNGEY